jgi:hypothetical protein
VPVLQRLAHRPQAAREEVTSVNSPSYVSLDDAHLIYSVRTTAEKRPVAGADSCIATVPPRFYATPGDERSPLDVRVMGAALRQLSEEQAAAIGETLHHADWTITDDPAVVEKIGMHGRPECLRCRGGVDQALAALADRRKKLLVGVLYWAAP